MTININQSEKMDTSILINKLFQIMEKNQNELLQKIDGLSERIDKIEEKITKIENIPQQTNIITANLNDSIVELKMTDLDIPKEEIIKALNYRDHRSIMMLFKKYYKNKSHPKYPYPIRIKSAKVYEYYSGGDWINDIYGYRIANIICTNFERLFIRYNDISDENIPEDVFLSNQSFISKLTQEKFKKDILKHILEEIRITSS